MSYRCLTQIRLQIPNGGENGGCTRQGNSIRRVNTGNTEKIDDTSNSLDGDREIKRRLIDRRNMMTRLS